MRTYLKILFVICVATFGVALLNPWSWLGELLVSFSVQYIIVGLLFIFLFSCFQMKKWMVLAFVFALGTLFYVAFSTGQFF